MYEDSVPCDRAQTMCHATRRGLCLELNDPKKMSVNAESQRDVLTSKDLGMLELTSPELERIILDPINDRFLGGRTAGFPNNSFHQQQQQKQPGHGIIERDQQESHQPFDSSLYQLRHQPNLPEPALEAVVSSSEEDSDMESRRFTYTPLVPPPRSKATTETGFSFNIDSKPVTLQAIHSAMSSVTAGGCSSSHRMGTLLPTAVHPGVSYLPSGTFNSVPFPRPKEEPMQLVPCLDGSPAPSLQPMSPINMDDQDRFKMERKRERNRLAARKCRTKKLEQIMVLEGRVKELKEQNRALGDTATALRTLMNRLQSQISQHISVGCPMMMMTTTMPDSSSSPSSFAAQ